MVLPKAYIRKRSRGFTLIEILISMALFSIIASTIAFVSLRSFTNSSLEQEEMLVVAILQKARSESLHMVCGHACTDPTHGVHIDDNRLVLFEGKAFDPNDPKNRIFTHLVHVHISGATDIYFPGSSTSIMIAANGKNATISVSPIGMIDWSL